MADPAPNPNAQRKGPASLLGTAQTPSTGDQRVMTVGEGTPTGNGIDYGYGQRADGSPKGNGYFGPQPRLDRRGDISTEITVGVNIGGKEVDVPTMVPTLNRREMDYLLNGGDPRRNQAIVDKAVAFARQRMAEGKPLFATPEEEGKTPLPQREGLMR